MSIAVIGVGEWGIGHARVASMLRAEGLVEDVYVVDIVDERLKYVSKFFGAKATKNFSEIVNNDEIEYAIIATPTKLHYPQGKELLTAGKNVLIEKPIAMNAEEALDLIDLAKQNNKVLTTGFLLRFSSAVEYVLNNNLNFVPQRVITMRLRGTPLEDTRKYDHGAIKDLAIHDIDLINYLFNAKPIKIMASTYNYDYYDVLTTIVIWYEKNNEEFLANITAGWAYPTKNVYFEYFNKDISIRIDLVNHQLIVITKNKREVITSGKEELLYKQDKNFVLAAQGKEKIRVKLNEIYKAMLMCDLATKSAKERRPIEVEH